MKLYAVDSIAAWPFLVFFIAIAREAGPSGLYERRRTYPGAGQSNLNRTAQAAQPPCGKPTGAALGLVWPETLAQEASSSYTMYRALFHVPQPSLG
jgi:hypothetical protein